MSQVTLYEPTQYARSYALVKSDAVYVTARNANDADEYQENIYPGNNKQITLYQVKRSMLFFDSGSIPSDAVIVSAVIHFYVQSKNRTVDFDVVVRDGQPDYPHYGASIILNDYDKDHYSGDGGSINIDSITTSAWNTITLNATGRDWIQKGAGTKTKFMLFTSLDIAGTTPTGLNQVQGNQSNFYMVVVYAVEPEVTIKTPTNILTTSAMGQGTIDLLGASDVTEWGFEYGLTQTPTWEVHHTGTAEAGDYEKAITGLSPNTTYWIRAYAINTQGTGYSEWIQFQTAAVGTIPVGTRINICSDYSGYTYKLNSSLLDDGESYESYFVLSTDLAQKQGLHINKRLLDIFSYFMKKESGTAKIYIKRDNETTWQYAGEISMSGDEDIIIKHLPSENEDSSGDVDFLAKSFLIKFLFANDFEFIGSIFESIPIGVR